MPASEQILFIGAGNMGGSLIRGLLDSGTSPRQICIVDPDEACRKSFKQLGIDTKQPNEGTGKPSDVVVIAVKPQLAFQALRQIRLTEQSPAPVLLSIVAGLKTSQIQDLCGPIPVVRAMPNTPALVRKGISAMYASPETSEAQRSIVYDILSATGQVLVVPHESDIDAVTAVSGSGPAYFFLFTEALAEAGKAIGLSGEAAVQLATATGIGAMALLEQTEETPETLRERVTSPGGTTEAALSSFQKEDLDRLVLHAVQAAQKRARELSNFLAGSEQ